MLVVMRAHAGADDISRVCEKIESLGFRPHVMPGSQRTAVGITGNPGAIDAAEFEDLPGVAEAIRVSKPYKLVSREVPTLLPKKNSLVWRGLREESYTLQSLSFNCRIPSRSEYRPG